jgi:hypothetical protein
MPTELFVSVSFSGQHSYYSRRGGHLKATKTKASAKVLPMHLALKDALLEWRSQSGYNGHGDFVFPSRRHLHMNRLSEASEAA